MCYFTYVQARDTIGRILVHMLTCQSAVPLGESLKKVRLSTICPAPMIPSFWIQLFYGPCRVDTESTASHLWAREKYRAQESRCCHTTASAKHSSLCGVTCAQIVKPDEPDTPDALEKGEAKGGPPAGTRPMQRDDTAHGSLARRAEARGAEE